MTATVIYLHPPRTIENRSGNLWVRVVSLWTRCFDRWVTMAEHNSGTEHLSY
ncbi:MAG: hypothetical protein P4M00_07850 [Azospirillaceae bacterium]|nr:hypothetical protein [Azospirillaceae bacterium]